MTMRGGLVGKIELTTNCLLFGKWVVFFYELLGGFRMFWGSMAGRWARLSLTIYIHTICIRICTYYIYIHIHMMHSTFSIHNR